MDERDELEYLLGTEIPKGRSEIHNQSQAFL